MEFSGLRVANGPIDRLRCGFTTASNVSRIQDTRKEIFSNVDEQNLLRIRETYGIHMAMRHASHLALSRRSNRPYGLTSSRILQDTLLGKDGTLNFDDYLGAIPPSAQSTKPSFSLH